ncbi:MAG TPA: D-alanyl-D-alanine carboxypeptidase family protein [Gaiellaceae bacterium]|nr:D-alanyl-D-alanine carboxypeptidase family protein [Gaiellaceae bacterium]
MRTHFTVLLVALAALAAWAAPALAAAPPPVEARAVLVADGRTGDVLHAENADRRLPMASITKLMTALVALEQARPGETATVAPRAVGQGGSSIYLAPGEQLLVRDLVAAALVQSANDAAFALAAHAGGNVERFVRLMNRKADELGLEDTNFVRPDGLDRPRHYSTAEDVFRLARVSMGLPLIRKLSGTKRIAIAGNRSLLSWNDLLWSYPGTFGVKTGHTNRAGWSQVVAARRGGTTLYAVILGSPSRERRNADLAEILDWGFAQYARFTLVREGERYATAAIPFSDERLGLAAAEGASRIVRLGSGAEFVERVVAPAMVELPVRRGQVLGEVIVTLDGREVARTELVATRDVEAPDLRTRVGWYTDRAVSAAGSMLSAIVPGI